MFLPFTRGRFLKDVTFGGRVTEQTVFYLAHHPKYRQFEIEKNRNLLIGGIPRMRTILEPLPSLKYIQERILNLILNPATDCLPECVHGCVPRRSVLTNAQGHVGSRLKIHMDVRDFFPTITAQRVYGVFRKIFGYEIDLAWLLTNLCCYQGHLPQGAPTSPMLANFVAGAMDRSLSRFIDAMRGFYTRYVDDLTFSFGRWMRPEDAEKFTDTVTEIVKRQGFTINEKKTSVVSRKRRMVVTGVIVNDRPSIPKEYRRNLRAALHQRKLGAALADPAEVIQGRLAYVRMVNPVQYRALVRATK